MRKSCFLVILSLFPFAAWPSPRLDGTALSRGPDGPSALLPVHSQPYSDMPILMRALLASRSGPGGGKAPSPRLNNVPGAPNGTSASMFGQDFVVQTKSQYISYLRNSSTGNRDDCRDKYSKYVGFFGHDSSLSGQISARDSGPAQGRLDTVCDFLGYAHWCFALGYAYSARDFDDSLRVNKGNKCFTYQEFCAQHKRLLDNSKTDEYLSKIIDEIMFYNSNIRNTEKNTVMVITETRSGPSQVTSTSWKGYDTDTWVQERIPAAEMIKLLCM